MYTRINKTLDYIDANLENPMTLGELASVANFSKYHFNRIFHSIVHETPFRFIQRVRIEKAAMLMLTDRQMSISEVALRCGFPDMKLNKSVEIKELPKMTLAYIRHIGPYKGDDKLFERLWNRLFAWAGPRGLIGGRDFRSLVIYHDDPGVTIEDKLRMSVCITVPPETKVDGDIGKMELEAAKYVIARFEVNAQQFQEAWDWLYGEWFPASGYQPDEKPCFEMYPEEPKDGLFVVDICVPVKPL